MKTLYVFLITLLTLICSQYLSAQTPPLWLHYSTANSSLPTNNLQHIIVDELNQKWIATNCEGLVMINEAGWNIYNTSNSSIPSNCLMSLTADNNSNLWVGGFFDNFNLAKYDGINWTVWNASNSPIVYDYVSSIAVDSSNKIWLISNNPINFGTANELFSFDGDTTWNYELGFMSADGYRKIIISGDSIITATTTFIGKLLILKRGGSNYEIGNFDGLYISDLKQDNLGNIWVAAGTGSWGYLAMYNGTSFVTYPYEAMSIEIDDENNVWIGTGPAWDNDTTKLIKYDGTNWTEYTTANSPLPFMDHISDLAFDNDGNLWITTLNSGLYIFNEEGITPVELITLSAEVLDNGVRLNWQTASETNNRGFDIERKQVLSPQSSVGNHEWEMICFVEGKGATTEQQNYSYVDENLSPGKYSYRLKQIDFDGSYEYSDIVEVVITPMKFSLSQNYPNPFNPSTKISWQSPVSSHQTLKVYDILGREVATLVDEFRDAGSYEVEFRSAVVNKQMASGVYYYQLRVGEFVQTKKMILIK